MCFILRLGLLPLVGLSGGLLTFSLPAAEPSDLPVRPPRDRHSGAPLPERQRGVRNLIGPERLRNIVSGSSGGLRLDLKDASISGEVSSGPYPFEAAESDYDHARFRHTNPIIQGRGEISLSKYFSSKYNANDWPASPAMTAAYRLHLQRRQGASTEELGCFDSVVSFVREGKQFVKTLTIVDGPYVALVRSDAADRVTIAWSTDGNCAGQVLVAGPHDSQTVPDGSAFRLGGKSDGRRHEVVLEGLRPGAWYAYRVECRGGRRAVTTRVYSFKTAPRPGEGTVRFAFASDSREGVGGGERNFMGVNFRALNWIFSHAFRQGADLFIFGGDLVNGYTGSVADFRLQLWAWKWAVSGFWRQRPVYAAMGNHETLLRFFEDGSALDRWPYDTESAEAVFAAAFVNPENGPVPDDPRRPPYRETAYSFQYGPVLFVAFNNNYWWTTNHKVPALGGCPEGYMLDDQLAWIERVLAAGERDSTVRYIVPYAQEPVFPCGGHLGDAMWWNGDNRVRAYTRKGDDLVPAEAGIIDVRNRFWAACARNPKVAAVLAGDEHAYCRLLIDRNTPVGVPATDDTDGDGRLDRASPNPAFARPLWHITVGSAGAPFYSQQKTPWEPALFSSQQGYALLEAGPEHLSLRFYTTTGQLLDEVLDLMAVKAH